MRLGRLRLGVLGGVSGLCCLLQSERISGEAITASALLSIEGNLAVIEPLEISLLGRVGLRWERFSGRATNPSVPETPPRTTAQTQSSLGALLQAGLGLAWTVEPLLVFGAIGVDLRPARLVVAPPAVAGEGPVDQGLLGPWIQLGLGSDFF